MVQTVEQMPSHNHFQRIGNNGGTENTRYVPYVESKTTVTWIQSIASMATSSSGGGQPMPIVNKYICFNMWQRTG